MSKVRAALYLRISLDRSKDELAVTRQREDGLALIADRGWSLAEEYVDNSVSAYDKGKSRPAYDRMVRDFEAGRFDALVCYDLDRLTRQPRQLEDWIDRAEDRGLRLVTANGEADLSTDAGRLFARIKAAVARGEQERKGARQTRALRQRAERGLPGAGVRLTGYNQDGAVIPDEAAMVRAVFDRFAAGESLTGITAWLQESGYPTRNGKPWNVGTVRQIVANPRYAGHATYKGEALPVRGDWEPIVSSEQFAAVQTILNDPRRRTNHRGNHRTHLGTGLYRCAECGATMRAWGGGRLQCRNRCFSRLMAPVDALVVELAARALQDERLVQRLSAREDSSELADLTAAIDAARDRLVTIESDYDEGLIDGRRYATATEKVNAEIADAERRQVALLSTLPGSVLGAADPAEAFRSAPLMIQQRVIDSLMVVRLSRTARGRHEFDPETVAIEWRQ